MPEPLEEIERAAGAKPKARKGTKRKAEEAMKPDELMPREQLLIGAFRRFGSLWPSRRARRAIGASFALNTVAMAASSGMGGPDRWIFSALQAAVMTGVCIAPALVADGLGAANRAPYRWTVIAALLVAVANVASAVVGGLART
jgi:hypothetical protein